MMLMFLCRAFQMHYYNLFSCFIWAAHICFKMSCSRRCCLPLALCHIIRSAK